MQITVEIKITDDERKIMALLADGLSVQEIVGKTRMSKGYIDGRIVNLRRLVGAANTTNLVAIALRQKLIN